MSFKTIGTGAAGGPHLLPPHLDTIRAGSDRATNALFPAICCEIELRSGIFLALHKY
jgi:hypothetical protein